MVKKARLPFARHSALYGAALLLIFAVALVFVQPGVSDAAGRVVLANIFQGFILAAAALLVGGLLNRWLKAAGFGRREYLLVLCFTVALCAAGMLFIFWYFQNEKEIKTYDFSLYWIKTLQDRAVIADSIPEYLYTLRDGLSNEYGGLPAFARIPFSYLFGTHYTGYCQSIFIVYYIPVCFLLSVFVLRILQMIQSNKASAQAADRTDTRMLQQPKHTEIRHPDEKRVTQAAAPVILMYALPSVH